MQSPVKNRKTMDSFYVFGDLHVFSDGTVQNMARGGKRWLGALSGPYYQVTNRGHSYYVHRLVAEGFCPRHSRNFNVVDHIDGFAKITVDHLARGVAELVQERDIILERITGVIGRISDNSRLRTR